MNSIDKYRQSNFADELKADKLAIKHGVVTCVLAGVLLAINVYLLMQL